MISERAVAEFVAVEVKDQATGLWSELGGKLTGVDVDRGTNSNGATETLKVGTSNLSLIGEIDLGIDTAVRPNSELRIRHKVTGALAYTGTIIDANQTFTWSEDRKTRRTHTSISSADSVQKLGNTPRYGAVAPLGAGRQSWEDRINQLNQSATVPLGQVRGNELPIYEFPKSAPYPPANDGWEDQVPNLSPGYGLTMTGAIWDTGNIYLLSRIVNYSQTPWSAPDKAVANGQYGIKKTFTGLTVGKSYRFYLDMSVYVRNGLEQTDIEDARWWRSQVDGKAWGPETRIGATAEYGSSPDPMAPLQFVATATTHTIRVTNARAFSIRAGGNTLVGVSSYFHNARLAEMLVTDDYELQDVAYESSLLNHYQLACDSVGARFWVDASNRVQFRRQAEDTAIVATFSDDDPPYGQVGWQESLRNVIIDPVAVNSGNFPLLGTGTIGRGSGNWLRLGSTSATPAILRMGLPLAVTPRPIAPGDRFAFRCEVLGHPTIPLYVRVQIGAIASTPVLVPAGGTVSLQAYGALPGTTLPRPEVQVFANAAMSAAIPAAAYADFYQFTLLVGPNVQTSGNIQFFAGFTPNTDTVLYQWTGPADNSETVKLVPEFGNLPETGYTDIDVSFDTRSVVNALTMSQHGRKIVNGDPQVDDYSATKTDPVSISNWGEREASMDTCLWLGAGHELDLDQRAREVFSYRAEPFYLINHVRFNAQSNVPLAFSLDVYSRIKIKFQGFTQVSRVARIKHRLSNNRWMVDLYLTDSTFGPTFDEFSDYYSGMTFDQLSDLLAGQTFDQLAKRTLQEH